jgi:hypothetical protein
MRRNEKRRDETRRDETKQNETKQNKTEQNGTEGKRKEEPEAKIARIEQGCFHRANHSGDAGPSFKRAMRQRLLGKL